MAKIPRFHVEVETQFVVVQASRRIHVCDSRSTAMRICRQWNKALRVTEAAEKKQRTATKGRDAKRAKATSASAAKK